MADGEATDVKRAARGFPTHVDRGGFRFFSGVIATGGGAVSAPATAVERAEAQHFAQAREIFDWLEQQTAAAGGISALARLHLYQQDKRTFPILEQVRIEREGSQPAPSSGIGVASLRDDPRVKWEIDGIALNAHGLASWGPRERVGDGAAGRSASHYSQVVRVGPYYFLAGMIPIDVDSGKVVTRYTDVAEEDRWLATGRSHTDTRRGPIVSQTASLLRRIFATVEELGRRKSDIVNCTMFIERALDFPDAVRVYDRLFDDERPALQVVVVDEVGHKDTIIEIECTVAADGVGERVAYPGLRDVPGAVATNNLVFFTDQIGVDETGSVATGDDALAAQLARAWSNLTQVVDATPCAIDDLASISVQVARPHPVSRVAELLRGHIGNAEVAVTVLSVDAVAHHPDALVALSAIGAAGTGG